MASAEINRLMDNARIKLPGALDSVLQMEFFWVMAEFFNSTNIWTEDIQFQALPTNENRITNPEAYTYTITPSSGTIVRVWSVVNSQGVPQGVTMSIPGEIVLNYPPNVEDTFTATVVKTVSDPVTREGYPEFPAWIMDKYGQELLDGLLGRMMSQLAKPYSSPQMAQYYLRSFRAGTNRAGNEAIHANLYRGQAWGFPQTFTRRRFTRI